MITLKDLHNPNKITSVLINNTGHVILGENQAFQTYPKCIELWQQLPDGRLFRVHRWNQKSIIASYIN